MILKKKKKRWGEEIPGLENGSSDEMDNEPLVT